MASTTGKCGAKNRKGGTCTLGPGWGTDHLGYGRCKYHGGKSPNGKRHAAGLMAADLVGEEDITAIDALEREVRRAAQACTWWASKVSELQDDQLIVRFERTKKVLVETEDDETGEGRVVETVTSTAAELNIAVQAFNQAQDRAVRIFKTAIELGIDERRVRALEEWVGPGVELLEALKAALWDRLDVEGQRVFQETARGKLLALEGGKP